MGEKGWERKKRIREEGEEENMKKSNINEQKWWSENYGKERERKREREKERERERE